jgi:hypothetical protein
MRCKERHRTAGCSSTASLLHHFNNLPTSEQVRNKSIQDGVCMLKVLIDYYYSSIRFTTIVIRKQLTNLQIFMQTVARGDVTKLCEHTRKLNAELEASGEKTQRRKKMWALKQLEWKEDASDLMDEAEAFNFNLREAKSWKRSHGDRGKAYALKASDASVSTESSPTQKDTLKTLKKQIKAFAAAGKQIREQKYKWKLVPPKDGESTTKKVLIDGVRKKYYWCVHQKAWTLHSPQECRKSEENKA